MHDYQVGSQLVVLAAARLIRSVQHTASGAQQISLVQVAAVDAAKYRCE
jgi:hypothetical protein